MSFFFNLYISIYSYQGSGEICVYKLHLWKAKYKSLDINLHCSSYHIKLSPLTNGHKEHWKIAVSM